MARGGVLNACDLKSIVTGREALPGGHDLPRHRHRDAYAIVVLRGTFVQTGYTRFVARAGDLVIQPTLDTHANVTPYPGVTILRLPWPDVDRGGVVALADVDAIARAAERDVREAVALVRAQLACRRNERDPIPRGTETHSKIEWSPALARAHVIGGRVGAISPPDPARARIAPRAHDLPDLLAADLVAGRVGSLASWAAAIGVARETCARAFTAAFGVSPRTFRCELRARAAWLRIVRTREPLAAIAHATGFADQGHMTRHVRALTGRPPSAWRVARHDGA